MGIGKNSMSHRQTANVPGKPHLDALIRGWSYLQLAVEVPRRVAGWDAVLLTAASDHQARLYVRQLDIARRNRRIPEPTRTLVVADRGGHRIGSGGATLNALGALATTWPDVDWTRRRVLLVHAGGDSRRVPWANLLGKPFIPFPLVADADEPVPTLFDHLMAVTAPLAPSMPHGGLLTLSGDVLPLFSAAHVVFPDDDGLVVTTPVPPDVASRHGVVVTGADGRVSDLLQKPGVAELDRAGAWVNGGSVLLDTGMYAFIGRTFEGLLRLARERPDPVEELVALGQECSLYEEVASALVPARHSWLEGRPLGRRLMQCLGAEGLVQETVSELTFVHLGSTAEVLAQFDRPWDGLLSRRILADIGPAVADTSVVLASRLAPGARVGSRSLVFASRLGDRAHVGNRCVVGGVDDGGESLRLPDHCCLWQVPLAPAGPGTVREAAFVCCGVDDNPKLSLPSATFCNRSLTHWLAQRQIDPEAIWDKDQERTLWSARLFPVRPSPSGLGLVAWMLEGGDSSVREAWLRTRRCSLAELHPLADTDAIFQHQEGLSATLVLSELQRTVRGGLDRDLEALARQSDGLSHGVLVAALADLVPELSALPIGSVPESRLWQMRSDLLGAVGDRDAADQAAAMAFAAVRGEVARAVGSPVPEPVRDLKPGHTVKVRLPVRFDIAGGWSDTPPYCLEWPACVLNLAMSLEGECPIGARVEALAEPVWDLVLQDSARETRVSDPTALASPPDLADPFLALKTALVLTGYGSPRGITQGARVTTWSQVPRGSGLGASSILGAALVRALQSLADRPDDVSTVSALVLALEQEMTTGGGFQDQIGGLAPGMKCISSVPTTPLTLTIEPVVLSPRVREELESRLVIAFTGQERLAKDVLQIVMGRYLRRSSRTVAAIARLAASADKARWLFSMGDLDGVGALLSEVWRDHQQLDPNCSNHRVDALFDGVREWSCGGKLAGAGGGGFAGIMARDAAAAGQIRTYLEGWGHGVRVYRWNVWAGATPSSTGTG
jgi:fucokinase